MTPEASREIALLMQGGVFIKLNLIDQLAIRESIANSEITTVDQFKTALEA